MLKNLSNEQIMKGGHYYDKADINRVKNITAEVMILLFAAWLNQKYEISEAELAAECKHLESWYGSIDKEKLVEIQRIKDILKEYGDLTIEFVE